MSFQHLLLVEKKKIFIILFKHWITCVCAHLYKITQGVSKIAHLWCRLQDTLIYSDWQKDTMHKVAHQNEFSQVFFLLWSYCSVLYITLPSAGSVWWEKTRTERKMLNHYGLTTIELTCELMIEMLIWVQINHIPFVAHYPLWQWYCISHSLQVDGAAGWGQTKTHLVKCVFRNCLSFLNIS